MLFGRLRRPRVSGLLTLTTLALAGALAAPATALAVPSAGAAGLSPSPEEKPPPAVAGRLLGLPESEWTKVDIRVNEGSVFRRGTLDGRGGYTIAELPPGEWQIRAATPSMSRLTSGTVRIEPQAPTVVLDLDFGSGEITLSGRVIVDGEPLAGASLHLDAKGESGVGAQRNLMTGADGRFAFPALASGRYFLLVTGGSGKLGQMRDLELDGDLDLPVDIETGSLAGRVVSTVTGKPVAGATLCPHLLEVATSAALAGPCLRTDEAGTFEVPRLTLGTYRLVVTAEGFADAGPEIVLTDPMPAVEVPLAPR